MALTKAQRTVLRKAPIQPGQTNKVRLALVLAGLRQGKVATATGLHQVSMSDVVNCKYHYLDVEKARRLARFFGVSIETLFPGPNEPAEPDEPAAEQTA